MNRGARAIAFLLDALMVLLGALTVWIIVTGGAVIFVRGQRISLTGVDNPILAVVLLCAIRYVALRSIPWLGAPRCDLARIDSRAQLLVARMQSRIPALPHHDAVRLVLGAILAATAVKASLAWTNPGFFSGDDVEVQEMSLRALWQTDWPIWELRNAFFPLAVLYPVQKLLATSSVATSAAGLITGGRFAIVLLSSIGIWLVWRIGRLLWPDTPGWAMVAALLFATAKLHIAFGSSELPRPVSTVVVLAAFSLLQGTRTWHAATSAVLLGVAMCFRFSEVVFLGPAVLTLVWQRRWLSAVAVVGIASGTAFAIIGLTDAWYWGEAFHSLRAAVNFTLIEKLSSRGYQSAAWYVLHAPEWINPAVAILAVIGTIRAPRVIDLWAWLPLIILSALPHKEARYAIPVVPFLCLIATRGLITVVAEVARNSAAAGWRPVALLALLAAGLLQDVGHWRLPRSNADVEFAKLTSAALPPGVSLSAEQSWRLGGHLYLRVGNLSELDPDRVPDPDYLWTHTPAGAWMILDRRTRERADLGDVLRTHGYRRDQLTVEGSRYELWKPGGG